jgi:regulator of sirC expression with transglutaminase-like and TPR domain
MPETTFQDEIAQETIHLPRAALCFAREIAYPDLELEIYLERLEGLAGQARAQLSPAHSLAEQAEALSDFLFIQQRLSGNSQEYNDPRNSYLNEVLERGLGIPISLSVIYITVAQECGLPAQGIGLPGHFIVGLQDAGSQVYIDPFHGGARLSQADCFQLMKESTGYQGPFQEDWLQPASAPAILTRMLNNLRNIYLHQEDWLHALRVVERLRLLQPQLPDLQRDLGVIYHRQGSLRLAAQYYEAYLRLVPQAPDAETVTAYLRLAAAELAKRN